MMDPVFFIACTSVSDKIEMKYLPLGLRLIVALIIRPCTSRLFANRTYPSFGIFILFFTIAIFLFVYFVVLDWLGFFFDLILVSSFFFVCFIIISLFTFF